MKRILAVILVLLTVSLLAVSCGKREETKPAITEDVFNEAVEMFVEYNKPTAANSVKGANFELPSKIVDYQGYDLDVAWEVVGGDGLVSLGESAKENTVTVKVNKYADKDTDFTMKGTVTCGEQSKTVEFKYSISQYVIATWEYWAENVKDVNMNIKGVVVAKYPYSAENKNTGVFIQDLDGEHGYFAYRMKCDSQSAYDTDLAIGNVIEVNGTTSIYNGFREIGTGGTYTVVTKDDGSVMTAEVKKVAIDELLGNATALDKLQGVICTLTGFKIKSIDWNTNNADNYYEKGAGSVYITVTKGGQDFKLYLSTSNQLTLDQLKSEYEKLGVGYTVNVEGPMSWYNAAQIYPCVGGITVVSTEVSAEDKIAEELTKVSLPASVQEATEITLPATGTTYTDVTYEWTVPEGVEGVAYADGKLTLTPASATTEVSIVLTAKCGDVTETKTFAVTLVVGEPTYEDIVNALYKLEKGQYLDGTFRLYGEIIKIDTAYSEQYNNITVTIVVGDMTDKPVQCFRMKGEGIADLKVGDKITVEGKLKRYNDTFEFDTGAVMIGLGEIIDPAKIVKQAYLLEGGATMENITLTGDIITINTAYSAQYGNITVTIVIGDLTDYPIQCFRAKGAEGIDVSGLAVGDRITITGTIKNFVKNNVSTIEFDAGSLVTEIVKAADV